MLVCTRERERTMARTDFRKEIISRLEKLGISINHIADVLKARQRNDEGPSRNALYTFLRGESDMVSENLARVLEVLDDLEAKAQKRK